MRLNGRPICILLLMLHPVLAQANRDLDEVCEGALKYLDLKIEKNCKANPNDESCQNIQESLKDRGGDQLIAHCSKAKLADIAYNYEIAKSIIFSAATMNCASLIFAESTVFTRSGSKIACSNTGKYAGAGALAADLIGQTHVKTKTSNYSEQVDGLEPKKWDFLGTSLITLSGGLSYAGRFVPYEPRMIPVQVPENPNSIWNYNFSNAPTRPMGGDEVTLIDPHQMNPNSLLDSGPAKDGLFQKAKQRASCLICSLSFGYLASRSVSETIRLNSILKTEIKNARSLYQDSSESVTGYGSVKNGKRKKGGSETPESMGTPEEAASCTGAGKTGDQVMNCLAMKMPEASAIVNNPELRKDFKRAFRGKDIGEVINEYDGKKKISDYLAAHMGMNPEFAAKAIALSSSIAEPHVKSAPDSPLTYAKNNGAVNSGSSSSKSELSVQSNLGHVNLGEDSNPENQSPIDVMYRQLELMSPEQIFENKNISLFVRIGYRYHKNSNKIGLTPKNEMNRTIGSERK